MTTNALEQEKLIFGHPKGLFVLFFTELWERFSYYGMRAILTLYVATSASAVDPGLGKSTGEALVLYGWYTMLVYVASIPGGWIADKFTGQKKAVMYGGFLLCLGHGILAVNSEFAFYSGLILIILGVGLLKPNISTMVGGLYEEGDPRRDSGFTIFYIGINIGAFLSSLIVGVVAFKYGWHYGFGLAGIGMLVGQAVFIYGQKYLTNVGNFLGDSKNKSDIELMNKPLSKIEKDRVIVLLISFLIVIVFWSAFEQAGGLLNLYTEAKVDRELGWSFLSEVPAAVFQSLNAGYIIIFGTLIGSFWVWMKKNNYESSSLFKMAVGTIIMGLGFVFMVFASQEASQEEFGKAAMYWIFLAYLFHTIGELCASPVALSFITKLSPVKYGSIMMGIYFAASGFGNKLAGSIGESSQLKPLKFVMTNLGKNEINNYVDKQTFEVKYFDEFGNKIVADTTDYKINWDKSFTIKSKLFFDKLNNQIQLIDYASSESLNDLINIKLNSQILSLKEEVALQNREMTQAYDDKLNELNEKLAVKQKDQEKEIEKVIEYLTLNNSFSIEKALHAKLVFEKQVDKIDANDIGNAEDYSVKFVVEEQQSEKEYEIFSFLVIYTVLFGFLVLLFLKKLKKLTHGAEDLTI